MALLPLEAPTAMVVGNDTMVLRPSATPASKEAPAAPPPAVSPTQLVSNATVNIVIPLPGTDPVWQTVTRRSAEKTASTAPSRSPSSPWLELGGGRVSLLYLVLKFAAMLPGVETRGLFPRMLLRRCKHRLMAKAVATAAANAQE